MREGAATVAGSCCGGGGGGGGGGKVAHAADGLPCTARVRIVVKYVNSWYKRYHMKRHERFVIDFILRMMNRPAIESKC